MIMKAMFSSLLVLASFSALRVVVATPVFQPGRAVSLNDDTTLAYALRLGQLDTALYASALARFSEGDFLEAGYDVGVWERVKKRAQRGPGVAWGFLEGRVEGGCEYDFPYTDVQSFVGLSQVLSGGLGYKSDAYIGSGARISEMNLFAALAAIINTQSTCFKRSNKRIGFDAVYTLGASMTTSCSLSTDVSTSLSLQAFPTLTFADGASIGTSTAIHYSSKDSRAQQQVYIAFFYGLSTYYEPVHGGSVLIPSELAGATSVYAVVTAENGRVDDGTVIAGPTVLEFLTFGNLAF